MQVGLTSTAHVGGPGWKFVPFRMWDGLRKELSSFRDLSAWRLTQVPLEDQDGSLRGYLAALVTGNTFQVVTMQPYEGRLLAPFDDVRGGPVQGWPVVLSYGFWSDHYGKDPSVIGRQIRIGGVPVTVVGVTPPAFQGLWPGIEIKLYLPMQFANVLAGRDVLNRPDTYFECSTLGRLKPSVSASVANAEAAHLPKAWLTPFIPVPLQHLPFFEKAYLQVDSARSGFPSHVMQTYGKPLFLMQGLVGVVLLLCCVNVGGLMMAKVYARQREFAIRTALGVGVGRLVRQYLTESFILALAGSLLGAVLAWRGTAALLHFFRDPMMGEAMEVPPDQSFLFVTGFLAVLTTLLFGILPAWRAGHADPGTLLKSRTSFGHRKSIAGRAFVPVQVALSLVLVTLASLLTQSVIQLRSERTGFDTDHVTIQTSPLSLLKVKGEEKLNLYQQMVDRLTERPEVRGAAATSQTPLTGVEITSRFQAMSEGSTPPEDAHMAFNDVGPGYFETMRTRLIAGREFAKTERSLNVCIVNQAAAHFLFPQQEALGGYVRALDEREFPSATACRIIGIAEDAKFSNVRRGPPRTIYFPLSRERIDRLGNLVFLINAGTKSAAISAFRKALAECAPTVPTVLFVTLREQMDAALGSQELITLLSSVFGFLALLLSALGLYGLLSASVAQRRSEMGLRIALGASRGQVIGIILREVFRLLGWGLLLDTFLLWFALRFIAGILYGVSAWEPLRLIAVVAVLTGVAVGAALIPAFRAATVDPGEALRAQ